MHSPGCRRASLHPRVSHIVFLTAEPLELVPSYIPHPLLLLYAAAVQPAEMSTWESPSQDYPGATGCCKNGSGNFKDCDLYKRARLIAPHSIVKWGMYKAEAKG